MAEPESERFKMDNCENFHEQSSGEEEEGKNKASTNDRPTNDQNLLRRSEDLSTVENSRAFSDLGAPIATCLMTTISAERAQRAGEAVTEPTDDRVLEISEQDTSYENDGGSSIEDDEHSDFCAICDEGSDLICCDSCPKSAHIGCLTPPLVEIPEGEWICPWCKCKMSEPPETAEKILTWRWSTAQEVSDDEVQDSTKTKQREFLVKWKFRPFLECEWVPELTMDVWFKQLLSCYWRKHPPDIPPESQEIQPNEEDSVESKSSEVSDKECLCSKAQLLLQAGVQPEWLEVQRVIAHQEEKGKTEYLFKWKELSYDQCTWHLADFHLADNCKERVEKYWAHRENMTAKKPENEEELKKAKGKKKAAIKRGRKRMRKAETTKSLNIDLKERFDQQPDYIKGGELHLYQLEGLNWLRDSWANGRNTILADEMGLGKTIQTIAFLYSLFKEGHCSGPFLISAPLSTVINWERELEMWAPDFYVVTYTGDKDSRATIRDFELSFFEEKRGYRNRKVTVNTGRKFHVLLTSYELVSMDSATLKKFDWSILVVDEAHRLKNSQSKFFRTLSGYSIQYKLLLTGTPLQNNMNELFYLLNFMSPNKFNDLDAFLKEFADISKEEQIERLGALLGFHMLRRLKTDVLDLPGKTEQIVRVELSPLQKKYYKLILEKNYKALSVKGKGGVTSLHNVLMELRKCCNHPYLGQKGAEDAPKHSNGDYQGPALVEACGKLLLLEKMLSKLKADGNRVLIFSQMTKMLDVLEDFLTHFGYQYERLDGKIRGNERQQAIDRFNAPGAEQFVFLLSTKAGGLGINLASADTVIIYDSDWNPHNDIQALSRAHRMGQANRVMVYRFVTKGTVEERVLSVAKKKMMLTHLVVRGANASQSMSKDELDEVLKWGTEELFREDANDLTVKKIVWDEEKVELLLKRQNSSEDDTAPEHWANEFLQSFKVAQYAVKEEDLEKGSLMRQNSQQTEPDRYWACLFGKEFQEDQEQAMEQLGRGKRACVRRFSFAEEDKECLKMDKDSSFSSVSSVDESEDNDDTDYETTPKKHRISQSAVVPLSPVIQAAVRRAMGFTQVDMQEYVRLPVEFEGANYKKLMELGELHVNTEEREKEEMMTEWNRMRRPSGAVTPELDMERTGTSDSGNSSGTRSTSLLSVWTPDLFIPAPRTLKKSFTPSMKEHGKHRENTLKRKLPSSESCHENKLLCRRNNWETSTPKLFDFNRAGDAGLPMKKTLAGGSEPRRLSSALSVGLQKTSTPTASVFKPYFVRENRGVRHADRRWTGGLKGMKRLDAGLLSISETGLLPTEESSSGKESPRKMLGRLENSPEKRPCSRRYHMGSGVDGSQAARSVGKDGRSY